VGSNRFIATNRTATFEAFTPGEWTLYVHENGDALFFVKVGRTYVNGVDWDTCVFRTRDLPYGAWMRLTATYDRATIRCYRDGVLVDSAPLPAQSAGPLSGLVIGRNYPGDVDALRIFNRALTTAEIAQPWP
jgi:hypothetical protein